jgi:hypothetical protein
MIRLSNLAVPLTWITNKACFALLPHVLDHVLVLLVGVQDVSVLADVLLAADVTDMLLVAVFSVAMLVLKVILINIYL